MMSVQIQKYTKTCVECIHCKVEYGFYNCHFESKEVIAYSPITNHPIYRGHVSCTNALGVFCQDHARFTRKKSIAEKVKSVFRGFWLRWCFAGLLAQAAFCGLFGSGGGEGRDATH